MLKKCSALWGEKMHTRGEREKPSWQHQTAGDPSVKYFLFLTKVRVGIKAEWAKGVWRVLLNTNGLLSAPDKASRFILLHPASVEMLMNYGWKVRLGEPDPCGGFHHQEDVNSITEGPPKRGAEEQLDPHLQHMDWIIALYAGHNSNSSGNLCRIRSKGPIVADA